MTIAIPRLDRTTAEERGLTLADFLVPISVAERINVRVRHIALILIGVLVVAAAAQIYIPTNPVPFTGQTLAVLVVGCALGFRRGAAALALYVLLGTIGMPIFAQADSGTHVILGATGGYLIGFVLAAAVVGRLAELGWDRRIGGSLAAMLIGSICIYAVGVPWLAAVAHLSAADAITKGFTQFLVWDAAKLAIAAATFPIAWWLIGRRPDDR